MIVRKQIVMWVFCILALVIFASQDSFAQIDSRNQVRPDREQNTKDPDKKKKKSKRIKSKKNPRYSGKKIYSNKKQLKRNKRAKAKRVDKSPKGDITGRKISQKRTPRTTVARSQPDPYKNRRIRTERSRAGPDAPEVRTATRKGERARTGDISGQKRVRQRAVRTAKPSAYPQPNPYVGRKIRTERVRAKSNTKQIRSIRSATKPSEPRQPRTKSAPATATAPRKVRQKKNVYRNHERTGGEKSTDKDIAGRKIRTKNAKSAIKITGGAAFSNVDPYLGRKERKEGERFKRSKALPSSARSITRDSESASRSRNDRYGQHRNRKSVRYAGVVAAKSVRSTSDPRRKGENPIYGNKYRSKPTRSVSGYQAQRASRGPKAPVSISGRRKQYRQRNTYQGKDRHFGENSSTKDIAGRRLRTRNYRSFNPGWAEFSGGTYGTGSAGKPSKKYARSSRGPSKASWNNNGLAILGKGRSPSGIASSQYSGRMPLSAMPSYGPGKSSVYRGRMKSSALGKYSGGNESLFAGRTKSKKRLYGGGSITKGWNNNGMPLLGKGPGRYGVGGYSGKTPLSAMPSYGPSKASTYKGRMSARNLGKYSGGNESTFAGRKKASKPFSGGGSITKGWNNNGLPLLGKGPGRYAVGGYSGKMPLSAMPSYGPSKATSYSGKMKAKNLGKYKGGNESFYSGNMRSYKPLKGGGSITRLWNNNGKSVTLRYRDPVNEAVAGYKGQMPLSAMPSYSGGKEGVYAGNRKAKKPLKGGGSITRLWNNNGLPIQGKGPGKYNVAGYQGAMPLSALPSYSGGKEGVYAGTRKAKKPIKGAGGSITRLWNNNGNPIEGKNPGKYDVGGYTGNMPLSLMPSYGAGKEGSYSGTMRAQSPPKGGGGSITRHWNNNGKPLQQAGLGKSDAKAGSYQGTMKGFDKPGKSDGTERGRSRSFSFLRIGDPNHMGLNHQEDDLKRKNDLPKELSWAERMRQKEAQGMDRGRTQSLSFIKIGDPTRGGLHKEYASTKRKSDLPKEIKGKNRLRLKEAHGMDNGRNYTFSFWAIGDPAHGGLVRNPAQAKGRLHPSANYTKAGQSRNALEEKEQPVKLKIWFAKIFKKNANQPDAVKEKVRRPRYDKNERDIWETAERPDWYNK